MTDLPKAITINEEGPREGFQIEPPGISIADRVRLIDALAQTGLRKIDCVSFVNPAKVPQMADAEDVVAALTKRPGVSYTGLWLNLRGFERASQTQLDLRGYLQISASETFSVKNIGLGKQASLDQQAKLIAAYRRAGVEPGFGLVMTAFGCNFEGDISTDQVIDAVAALFDLATDHNWPLPGVTLADTVGYANPQAVLRTVGAVRDRWPDLTLALHLHDTRGTGLANAYAAMTMGVAIFDASCAGLGGCPFAGHHGAAGNICTEDLAFMAEEVGIHTGIDLDSMVAAARLAEHTVGHALPGKVMRGGTLTMLRNRG